jgi:hypothetical protein
MVSKIPPSPAGIAGAPSPDGVVPGIADRAEALPGVSTPSGASAADAVTRIAADVAEGRISRDEAVERIIAEALDSEMIHKAPSALRAEITQALEALVATDPHLQALVRGLGPASSGDVG